MLRIKDDLKNLIEATGQVGNLKRALDLQRLIQEEINSTSLAEKYKKAVTDLQKLLKDENDSKPIYDFGSAMDQESELRILKLKSLVTEIFNESDKWAIVKDKGRDGLTSVGKRTFDELDSLCRTVGIFIVPCGSLESWLSDHGIPKTRKNKAKWISRALVWLEEHSPVIFPAKDFIAGIHKTLTGR